MARARRPADQGGTAGAIGPAQQHEQERQPGNGQGPEVERGLSQRRQHTGQNGQRKLAAQTRRAGLHFRRQAHAASGPSDA